MYKQPKHKKYLVFIDWFLRCVHCCIAVCIFIFKYRKGMFYNYTTLQYFGLKKVLRILHCAIWLFTDILILFQEAFFYESLISLTSTCQLTFGKMSNYHWRCRNKLTWKKCMMLSLFFIFFVTSYKNKNVWNLTDCTNYTILTSMTKVLSDYRRSLST